MISNLFILSRIIEKGFKPNEGETRATPGALFIFGIVSKTLFLYGAVTVAILYYNVNALGFLIGISVLFASLLIGSLL